MLGKYKRGSFAFRARALERTPGRIDVRKLAKEKF